MKTVVLDPALREFSAAGAHYNKESPGLGCEFADKVFRTIARVAIMPDAWPALSERTRRCITRRFPYGVIYQQREDALIIVSIMHLRRHPESWKRNLMDS